MRGQLDALVGRGIGHIAGIGLLGHKMPDEIAKSVNAIQRYLVTETRLKIPAIFHNEALNGVVAPGFTTFPTPLGLAVTWEPPAVEEMADILRRQMRSVGLLHALSPVIDLARDARWGRVTETYGEDPYLVSAMSVAFTRGMQGEDLREGVIACAKHSSVTASPRPVRTWRQPQSAGASSTTPMPAPSRPPSGSPASAG
jgi:beta-glucosidase